MGDTLQEMMGRVIGAHLKAREATIANVVASNGGIIPCTTCGDPAVAQIVGPDSMLLARPAQPGPAFGNGLALVETLRFACSACFGRQPVDHETRDVDGWFELTYSNYLVLPRALMQSMPPGWQHRMVTCLDEIREAFSHLDSHPDYRVETGEWRLFSEIAEQDYERLGITLNCEDDPEQCREPGHVCTYSDADGNEIDEGLTRIFYPVADPIPSYDRGRTRVPRIDQTEPAEPVVMIADCPICAGPVDVVAMKAEKGQRDPVTAAGGLSVYVRLVCGHIYSGTDPTPVRIYRSIRAKSSGGGGDGQSGTAAD